MIKIGVDVGIDKIKAVEVNMEKDVVDLLWYDISEFPGNAFYSDSNSDREQVVSFLKNYFLDTPFKSSNIVVGIPESKVFTRVIEIPNVSKKELSQTIKWEAEQYIPIPLSDLTLQYQTLPLDTELEGGSSKIEVLLVGVQKISVEKYVSIFDKCGVNIVGIEPESMAIARTIANASGSNITTMAVNIGIDTTDIIISQSGFIRFTRSIPTGTLAMGRAIARDVGLEENQAKSYLESYGLDESKLDGRVKGAIDPVFNSILSELRRSISYYQDRKKGKKISRVVLCGEGARIPQSLTRMAGDLDVEVQLSNPWEKMKIENPKIDKDTLMELGSIFTTAVGLAIKEV